MGNMPKIFRIEITVNRARWIATADVKRSGITIHIYAAVAEASQRWNAAIKIEPMESNVNVCDSNYGDHKIQSQFC